MTGTLNGGEGEGAAKKRSSVYEKYLNLKQSATPPSQQTTGSAPAPSSSASALPSAAAAPPTMTIQEITNSTDELELEAGEVVSEPAAGSACADENQDVNIDRSKQQRQRVELEGLSPAQPPLKAHPQPTAAAAAALNDRGDAAVELLKPSASDLSNHALTTAPSSAPVDVSTAATVTPDDAPVAALSTVDPPAAAADPTVAAVNALVDAGLDASVAPAGAAEPTAKPPVAPSSPEKFLGMRNTSQGRPNERDNGHGPPGGLPRGPDHGGQAPPDWRQRSPPRQMNGHGGRPDGPEFDRRPNAPMSPRRMQGGPPPPRRSMGSPRRNGSPRRGPPPPNGRGRSRSRSLPRHNNNNGPGPFRGPQPDQPQGRRSPPPSKYEPLPNNNNRPPSPRFGDRPGPGGRRSLSPDRRGGNNFNRGPPGDFRGPSPGRAPPGGIRGPPGDFRGPSPGHGPPPHGDYRGRSSPRHNGPFNGPPPGPGGPRRSRSRSPPRGGPGSRAGSPPRRGPMSRNGSPPRDGRFGPENGRGRGRSRSRSPPRDNGGPIGPGRNGSPPRYIGRTGSPPRHNGRDRSPPRGPPGPGRPGSPPRHNGHPGSPSRFGRPGPEGPLRHGPGRSRSPQRDSYRGQPPPYHMDNRGPPPPHHNMGNRGPPQHYMDNHGPPQHHMDNRGPPPPMNGHMPPPRDRSRSQGRDMEPRKRDRSWEREAPLQQHPGMRQAAVVYPMGDWAVELKRSGKPKCRCRGAATGLPASMQLPLTLDVVQLPHLDKYSEFLMMSKRDLRRSVYELLPESDADRRGYDEFRDYLVRGRNVPRAGLASEMDAYGYKVFILPPGTAARALGYKGEQMIAVIRRKA